MGFADVFGHPPGSKTGVLWVLLEANGALIIPTFNEMSADVGQYLEEIRDDDLQDGASGS